MKLARRDAPRALAAMRVPYKLFARSRSGCELIFSLHQGEQLTGRETPMAYVNVAGAISSFEGSHTSAVSRVGIPQQERSQHFGHGELTLQVSWKARWTFATASSVLFGWLHRAPPHGRLTSYRKANWTAGQLASFCYKLCHSSVCKASMTYSHDELAENPRLREARQHRSET